MMKKVGAYAIRIEFVGVVLKHTPTLKRSGRMILLRRPIKDINKRKDCTQFEDRIPE